MRHLIMYTLKTKANVFSHLKLTSISSNQKSVDLSQNIKTFSCNPNPKLSWVSENLSASNQWIPISTGAVSGFIYSHSDAHSSWCIEMQLKNESGTSMANSHFSFDCSREADQNVVFVPIQNHPSDELYLYYLFVDEYTKPTLSLGHPKAAQLRPVSYPNQDQHAPMMMGHAGAGVKRLHHGPGRQWPENTICAFQRAQQLHVPMVECDATVTRDCADVVLHHNFTLKIKSKQPGTKPVLEHLADGCVDQNTTDLIARFKLSDLRSLLDQPEPQPDPPNLFDPNRFSYPAPLTMNDPEPNVSGPEASPVPLLKHAFLQTSTQLGFNIEMKYPPETPYILVAQYLEAGQPIPNPMPGPYSYFCSINRFCDTVLDIIWKYAGPRPMALSSFNPDICLALRLKQADLPVLFITRGGDPSDSGTDHRLDPRHFNVTSAAQWASLMNLQGLVTLGQHFGSDHEVDPNQIALVCQELDQLGLACFVYGPGVSDAAFRAQATKCGLSGLIIDRVDEYMHEYVHNSK